MNQPLTSRGLIGYAGAVLAGGISAALFAVARAHAETLLVFLTYLTPIPLFVSGLGSGAKAGVVASITGVLALYAMQVSYSTGTLYDIVGYLLAVAIPVAALTALALRYRIVSVSQVSQDALWCPEGILLSIATLYPCLMFVAAFAATWNIDGGLLHLTSQTITTLIEPVKEQWAKEGKLDADALLRIAASVQNFSRMVPAVIAWSWVAVMFVASLVAQRLLTQNKWQLRTPLQLKNVYVPSFVLYAAAVSGLVAIFAQPPYVESAYPYSYVAYNLCMTLFLPIIVVGLAVMHTIARTTRYPVIILTLFYVILAVMVWPIFLVALLGVLDQWMNFRRRLASGTETAN